MTIKEVKKMGVKIEQLSQENEALQRTIKENKKQIT
jgi:predicted RNase H-like nuclease (RuvC/YqgF family)